VQQRQSHKQKQMREAREWLAQQQQHGNGAAAPSFRPPCAAADLCTFWKVMSRIRSRLIPNPVSHRTQDCRPCPAGTFCPHFARAPSSAGSPPQPSAPPLPAKVTLNSLSWCKFVAVEQRREGGAAGAPVNWRQKQYSCSVCGGVFKSHQYPQHVSGTWHTAHACK
jgi:hypothetical protein